MSLLLLGLHGSGCSGSGGGDTFQGSSGGTAPLTVTDAVLTTLTVTPANALSAPGTRRRYRALGTFSDGTQVDLASQVTWSTSNAAVATIANVNLGPNLQGQATVAGASGQTVTIQAALGATPGQTTLSVGVFAFTANSGSNNVSAYTLDPATGALAAAAGSPFPAGSSPFSVTTTP